jgi:heterodisulfide reductase subunit A
MANQKVLVVGGGIGGLTVALVLARCGLAVDVVERDRFLGGHAAQFACKSLEACVACGACRAEEAIEAAAAHPGISMHTSSGLESIRAGERFAYRLRRTATPAPVGTRLFHRDGCALETAPADAGPNHAFFSDEADAVVLATGFATFDPSLKPYGYGRYPNVITNLELDRMLRADGRALRPSDGAAPGRIAFIQCVGSRDAGLGHLWCSKFCCPAALRSARLIKKRRPQTEITIFHIDIQSFGRDFEAFFGACRRELGFVRAIPADAFQLEDDGLRLAFRDDPSGEAREEQFDLVVLSVGMVPPAGLRQEAAGLGIGIAPSGFAAVGGAAAPGVFTVGAVRGAMRIAETIADAHHTAGQVLAFLGRPARGADPARRPAPDVTRRLIAPGASA